MKKITKKQELVCYKSILILIITAITVKTILKKKVQFLKETLPKNKAK